MTMTELIVVVWDVCGVLCQTAFRVCLLWIYVHSIASMYKQEANKLADMEYMGKATY